MIDRKPDRITILSGFSLPFTITSTVFSRSVIMIIPMPFFSCGIELQYIGTASGEKNCQLLNSPAYSGAIYVDNFHISYFLLHP